MAAVALTFGSVGDIISLCTILSQAINALSDSSGSATQYRRLRTEIWNLSRALTCVESLFDQNLGIQRQGDLKKIVSDCRDRCIEFLERIEGFESLSQNHDLKVSPSLLYRKLRWPAYQKECETFRQELSSQLIALLTILATVGIVDQHTAYQSILEALSQFQLNVTQKLTHCETIQQESITNISNALARDAQLRNRRIGGSEQDSTSVVNVTSKILQTLDSNHEEQRTWYDNMQRQNQHPQIRDFQGLVRAFDRQFHEGLHSLSCIAEVLKGLLRLGYLGALFLIQTIEQHILRYYIPSIVHRTSILYFEDAILNRFQIDVSFTSYGCFIQDLERHFAGTTGEELIKAGSYIFENSAQGEINMKRAWDNGKIVGKHIFMRAIIKLHVSTNPCSTCKHQLRDSEIQQNNQGLKFEFSNRFEDISMLHVNCKIAIFEHRPHAKCTHHNTSIRYFFGRVKTYILDYHAGPGDPYAWIPPDGKTWYCRHCNYGPLLTLKDNDCSDCDRWAFPTFRRDI